MRISDWSSDVCSSDLLPGCELNFSEHLGLESVIRAGVDESCASLSRGTQEQLAVLTRIAFADMLLEQGKPVSLILDDPLVYSDDARLDTMIEILSEAASRDRKSTRLNSSH